MERIDVTKAFLPPLADYQQYIVQIWQSGQLTNQGPLVQDLETKLKKRIDTPYLHLVTNGTLALQLALRAYDVKGKEVITTPFSYVASTSAILWEGATPIYVDIDKTSLCIDPKKIEAAITQQTKAILAVHVFGNACDIDAIAEIADRHNLPVIYDGAHAFGADYKSKSLLSYGDITICSFHATKLFHTVEGGAVITNNSAVSEKIELLKRFGHNGDDHIMLGINAKSTELQAAMGLCNLKYVDEIIQKRKSLVEQYDKLLTGKFEKTELRTGTTNNYAYYPIIFSNKVELDAATKKLQAKNIFPRRYFYPSLNKLPYLDNDQACPVSESVAERILCLPLSTYLDEKTVQGICEVLLS